MILQWSWSPLGFAAFIILCMAGFAVFMTIVTYGFFVLVATCVLSLILYVIAKRKLKETETKNSSLIVASEIRPSLLRHIFHAGSIDQMPAAEATVFARPESGA